MDTDGSEVAVESDSDAHVSMSDDTMNSPGAMADDKVPGTLIIKVKMVLDSVYPIYFETLSVNGFGF